MPNTAPDRVAASAALLSGLTLLARAAAVEPAPCDADWARERAAALIGPAAFAKPPAACLEVVALHERRQTWRADPSARRPPTAPPAHGETPPPIWIAGPPGCFAAADHHYRPLQTVAKQIVLINDHDRPRPYTYRWEALVNGRAYTGDEDTGELPPGAVQCDPLVFKAPPRVADRTPVEIKLTVKLGETWHTDSFSFRVFEPAAALDLTGVAVFDPPGRTRALLDSLGPGAQPWNGETNAALVVVGCEALSSRPALPGDLRRYVRQGGRLLLMRQTEGWLRQAGFRLCAAPARQVFPVAPDHPALAGLEPEDLRDWAGATNTEGGSTEGGSVPCGIVAPAPLRKPHRGGWRPLLECGFDLGYVPLLELNYGRGRVLLCALALEACAAADPAAERLARRLVAYARDAPPAPRETPDYLGDDRGAELLDRLGVVYRRASAVPDGSRFLILGQSPVIDPAGLKAALQAGGRALCLPSQRTNEWAGIGLRQSTNFPGSLQPPPWPETAGLSAADLRRHAPGAAWLVEPAAGWEVAADGLLARRTLGQGVLLVAQMDPSGVTGPSPAAASVERARQTRALAQLLANMGALFAGDHRFWAAFDPAADAPPGEAQLYESEASETDPL